MNLIDQFNQIKSNHLSLLTSENEVRRDWGKAEIRKEIRYRMQRNLLQGRRDWRYQNVVSDFQSLQVVKVRSAILNVTFKKAIPNHDISRLMDLLNNRDYWLFRNLNDWVDILNGHDDICDGEITTCEDCNALEYLDDGSWAYDGDRFICQNCRDRHYHWSDYRDTYIHDDDEDDEDNGIIGEYHSSSENLGHIPSSHDKHKNPIYLGLELEMETTDGADRYTKAEQLLNAIGRRNGDQYCLLENDGSLDDGFEMVTGYTGLDTHADQLQFFKQPFKGMRSHDTRTCGLHIHICKKGMTMSHASKLILFINESSNQRLVKAIARRENPDYAKIKNKRADYRWLKNAKNYDGIRRQLMELNEDRYEALNFKNPNTVEFRMFKGTLKYETIMACLEFTYASWHFAKETGIQNLTTEDFLSYISKPAQLKTTKFLREYLQGKGFNIPTPVKQNPRIEQPAQQLAEV